MSWRDYLGSPWRSLYNFGLGEFSPEYTGPSPEIPADREGYVSPDAGAWAVNAGIGWVVIPLFAGVVASVLLARRR